MDISKLLLMHSMDFKEVQREENLVELKDENIVYLISKISKMLEKDWVYKFQNLSDELNREEIMIIYALNQLEVHTVTEIAKTVDMKMPNVSRSLKTLLEKGYVEFMFAENNKKVKYFFTTPMALDINKKIAKVQTSIMSNYTFNLNNDEKKVLFKLLIKFGITKDSSK